MEPTESFAVSYLSPADLNVLLFPPTCHTVMGLWKIWPPAAHLAHAAVLNRGQALDSLTSQRSAGKIKRWIQQTQVKSELVIPISFFHLCGGADGMGFL